MTKNRIDWICLAIPLKTMVCGPCVLSEMAWFGNGIYFTIWWCHPQSQSTFNNWIEIISKGSLMQSSYTALLLDYSSNYWWHSLAVFWYIHSFCFFQSYLSDKNIPLEDVLKKCLEKLESKEYKSKGKWDIIGNGWDHCRIF